MSNPNWPSFPGLQNLTQDGDGRPQVLDLIPGRQRGTPLNSLLFNPLIRAVCDLRDTADDQSAALRDYLPLVGGTLSGPLTVQAPAGSGNTLFGGGLVSSVAGQTANAYLQLQIVNGQPLAIVGIQDSNGWHNWTFNPAASSLTNPVGNSIPEVVGPTGRVAIQSFTLSFQPIPRTGSQVPVYSIRWPQPFRSTPQVFFQIDWENGTSVPSPRTVNIAPGNGTSNNNVDIYGARINITYTNWSNSNIDTTNAPISSLNVLAIGEM
ncbi:hypothetical protein J3T99_02095 [Acetobacteraceae bacterium B3987]|nr:hypothetical protein [Acetobacteraceae bacterium B3987]